MGGKKKKSAAAQAATPVAPSAATSRTDAAVAGNGVPEEAKKQQNSNKLTKSTKENKSKGNFSLFGYCHRFRNTSVCIPRHRECSHVSVFWLKAQNPIFMRILVVSNYILYRCSSLSQFIHIQIK